MRREIRVYQQSKLTLLSVIWCCHSGIAVLILPEMAALARRIKHMMNFNEASTMNTIKFPKIKPTIQAQDNPVKFDCPLPIFRITLIAKAIIGYRTRPSVTGSKFGKIISSPSSINQLFIRKQINLVVILRDSFESNSRCFFRFLIT